MVDSHEKFVPKPEFTTRTFDPNIRHRVDEVHPDLLYRGLQQVMPEKEPQSCYVAIQHKGKTYHLFNAERIPLGRMARMCAVFIRGKHKPVYDAKKNECGDICVIVNAKNLYVTGKKKDLKLYRHHTQYFSGLKEYNMRELLEKDPHEVIYRAVKGMVPKNKLREDILK